MARVAKPKTGMLAGRFPYVETGHGERLALVLPGSEELLFGIQSFPWLFTRLYGPLFPKGFKVMILGYGEIRPGQSPIDIAIDIGKAIKGNHAPDVVLGLSFGGLVTIAFGIVHPRLARRLVIASAAHDMSPGGLETATGWMNRARQGTSRELFASFLGLFKRDRYKKLFTAGLPLAWPWLRRRVNPSRYLADAYDPALAIKDKVRDFLPALRKPTMVLGGSCDQLFPESAYRELASLAPGAVLELVEGETHTLLFENKAECKARLARFLGDGAGLHASQA